MLEVSVMGYGTQGTVSNSDRFSHEKGVNRYGFTAILPPNFL